MSLTHGERNNNPGNIKADLHFDWKGQTGQDEEGFCTFDRSESGIRAIAVILRNYQKLHNISTTTGLITRWSETDRAAYIRNVSEWVGLDPGAPVSLDDKGLLVKFVRAIIRQENGQVNYDDSIIQAGVSWAISPKLAQEA